MPFEFDRLIPSEEALSRWERVREKYLRHLLTIDGVEVTQAIQYYRADQHLTDPSDRGPDNSLTLVAFKPAWVRVYIHSVSGLLTGVSGSIEIRRIKKIGGPYEFVTTLSPQSNSTTTALETPTYVGQRSNVRSTVNFIIPSDEMYGYLRLNIKVSGGSFIEMTRIDILPILLQTLRFAAILVSYNGSDGIAGSTRTLNLPATSLADLQKTAATSLTMYPVESEATYRLAGSLPWSTPLNDKRSSAGRCSTNWDAFLKSMAKARTSDGNRNDVIYYALLPRGTPLNVPGCTDYGVSAGQNGDEFTMAHEMAHQLGLVHTPCGPAGSTDSDYPTYEPYPSASIGEYGLDINNGNILRPMVVGPFDFMSYCFPQWMSVYHHKKLINNPLLNPRGVGIPDIVIYYYLPKYPHFIPDPWPPKHLVIPEEWLPDIPANVLSERKTMSSPPRLISIIGTVSLDKKVEVDSVVQLEVFPDLPRATQTDYLAELIDKNGKTLAIASLYRFESLGRCNCSQHSNGNSGEVPFAFQTFLDADINSGSALRIMKGDKELWSRRAPKSRPNIKKLRATVRKNILVVEWSVQQTGIQNEPWLQWSDDDGKNWYGLSAVKEKRAEFSTSLLPAGSILIRLLAHNGFYTTTSDPFKIKIPKAQPSVVVMNPPAGIKIPEYSTLRLWGKLNHNSKEPNKNESAKWLIDDDEVGQGYDIFITAPRKGKHSCKLVVVIDNETIQETLEFETLNVTYMENDSTNSI